MNKEFNKIIDKLEEEKMFYFLTIANTGDEKLDYTYEKVGNALDKAIEIVKQESEQYKLYDTISIHTNGLEEGIRCAVCTNQIKSDTGCDGGCCVDKNLVKRICDVIHKFECKPCQPKGE